MLNLNQLSAHKSYLLALSGGRDSVCLLHLLLEKKFRNLHLVHLNHQLRGNDSQGDADFVRDLAEQHQLPVTIDSAPVAELAAQSGESLETSARKARHLLFSKVAHETSCSQILLAHHADDQAETCLFNLLRGSSGIKGMALKSEFDVGPKKLTFLRPLLHTRRSEIDAFLTERGIPYRNDQSNLDPAYTRNRMRHEALPLLENILNRDIVPSLIRAEEATREKEQIIACLLDTLSLRDPQGRLFLPKLRSLPPELQFACLKQYLAEEKVIETSKPLINRALLLISPNGPPSLNLPGNRFLRRKEARIFIS